ncbi:preprotein translocase subunit SecA [Anaerotignum sp. MB30-C6]|uniref:preprotein translocase subunit SecA n=1 Tax=Anaerotignum sp. MB30-C6 TaxID=3070814 RepID=UPI0027DD4721|nr:preprotein translocase subunit SecA [Anaerotignum sp. MB30-C6]WMI81370.1 preprotein translocase subunit SecA [Anaerotignum sp. MB30-C6]
MGFLEKIFGSYSEKEIKRITPIVKKIEGLAPQYENLTDEELRGKTQEFKDRLAKGETLDDLLPEAYAVVREAASRPHVLNMRHFPVQLMGGIVMHQGRIAEMRTGEGKTLVATLPAYLNALEGKGVHVITVNDYLAQRDSEWMGEVFRFLGLSVGCILNGLDNEERRAAYACDITYGTNNEFGFDYLRDNMVVRKESMVQRELHFSIIDEVDSVLIDEARTPLIISGSGSKSTDMYRVADIFVKQLKKGRILNEEEAMNPLLKEELQEEGDFVLDEKAKSVVLTQEGVEKAEKFFSVENLSDPENLELQHHINNALKANYNMHLDKDYVIAEGEIVIVDEFTGRMMPGRRYSDGLHQAIEAKENVQVRRESKTLATITFQNYFNKYKKKAGMTGTAKTEEEEFRNIYGMDVVEIPTNRTVQRKDAQDVVYRTEAGKFRAVVKEIAEAYEKGQPVLVGTVTIDKSEELSKLLKREGIKHQVLNAKYHAQEAEIVSLAGQKGAVTIATNMAGRGTDIKLGEGVAEIGGLKIIGTERHESRRIDNQLRGRAGRQGDPGDSRFYISLEDDLMRLFGSERTMKLVDAMGMSEDEPIEAGMLTKAIENAQKKVEGNNFAIRKHLLEYDQVMNEQREIIYGERRRVLYGEDLRDSIIGMIGQVVGRCVDAHMGDEQLPEDWDMASFSEHFAAIIPVGKVNIKEEALTEMTKDKLKENLTKLGQQLYEMKEKEIGEAERMRELERVIMLRVIDQKWMDHIDEMDRMRQGIGLHAYAQRDPLMEYKFAAYDMFDELSRNIQEDTLKILYRIRIQTEVKREEVEQPMFTNKDDSAVKQPKKRKEEKVGRNDPCPCGSGKKYKQCCGR